MVACAACNAAGKNPDARKKQSNHKVCGVSPEAEESLWWEKLREYLLLKPETVFDIS